MSVSKVPHGCMQACVHFLVITITHSVKHDKVLPFSFHGPGCLNISAPNFC